MLQPRERLLERRCIGIPRSLHVRCHQSRGQDKGAKFPSELFFQIWSARGMAGGGTVHIVIPETESVPGKQRCVTAPYSALSARVVDLKRWLLEQLPGLTVASFRLALLPTLTPLDDQASLAKYLAMPRSPLFLKVIFLLAPNAKLATVRPAAALQDRALPADPLALQLLNSTSRAAQVSLCISKHLSFPLIYQVGETDSWGPEHEVEYEVGTHSRKFLHPNL